MKNCCRQVLPAAVFLCPKLVCPVRPRHIIRKKRSFAAFSLLRSSFLLMKWRSPRAFLQPDFPASRKSGCKKARVNLVDHMVLQPLAGVEAEHENDRTHAPVCEHADPNRDGTEVTEAA